MVQKVIMNKIGGQCCEILSTRRPWWLALPYGVHCRLPGCWAATTKGFFWSLYRLSRCIDILVDIQYILIQSCVPHCLFWEITFCWNQNILNLPQNFLKLCLSQPNKWMFSSIFLKLWLLSMEGDIPYRDTPPTFHNKEKLGVALPSPQPPPSELERPDMVG